MSPLSLAAVAFLGAAHADPPQPEPITKLKPLYPRTVLVEDGQPKSVIVVPDAAEYAAPARRVADLLERLTGAKLRVLRASDCVSEDWTIDVGALDRNNPIALGNVNNNRLLSALYGPRYVVADSLYPGEGGHVVRTIHDPFADGTNVLALAGSDVAGVEQAIAIFAGRYAKPTGNSLVLEQPIIDVKFEKKAYPFFPDASHSLSSKRQPQYTGMDWFKQQLQSGGFMDAEGNVVKNTQPGKTLVALTGMIARIGQTYFRTGNPELPPLMKELLDKNRHLLSAPEPLHEMGARAAWNVPQWDLVEELPVWTDQDRLDMTNALLRDAALGHERRAFHNQVEEGAVMAMDENHGTSSARNSFVAWHYFHKYYPSAASDYWMRCAKAVFDAQASTFQIPEDACGYLCYCPGQAGEYALRSGNLTYFTRGVARHHAEYIAQACVNNLGLATGFGDCSGIVYPGIFEALAPAAWFYRDPKLYWILRNKLPVNCGLRIFQNSLAFDLDVKPEEPMEWTGLIRIPLYEAPLAKGDASDVAVFAKKTDVDPRLFNKLVFRENWSENGQYLLLDGAGVWDGPPGPHGHKHNDLNTLINFTSHGRMWLVDHTYQIRSFADHSGVYTLCDGVGGYRKRTLANLLNLHQTNNWGLSRTRFLNWERAIFWKKGSYFVVIDTTIADKPGNYFARCSFRALGEEELRGKALYLAQDGKFCKILSDGGANVDVEHYRYTDSQWETFYPHAEPVVRIFQQDKHGELQAGESLGFVNLLCAYGSKGEEGRVSLQAASDQCALVVEGGKETLIGVGEIPGGAGSADLFVLSADASLVLGTKTPDREAIAGALAAAHRQAADRKARAVAKAVPGETRELQIEPTNLGMPLTALHLADLDADGTSEWLAAGDQGIAAFRRDGTRLWLVKTEKPVRCLAAADVDGDGHPEIALGGEDEHIRLLDAAGNERWSYKCKASQGSTDGPPAVDDVKIVDLDGDGKQEVVGGANWVHVLNADGSLKWEKYMDFRRGRSCGDFAAGDVSDLDSDGKQEVVALFMTSYPVAVVYDAQGNLVMPADGPGGHGGLNIDVPVACATMDLFGGGKSKQIVYVGANRIGFLWHDQKSSEQAGGNSAGTFVAMAHYQPDPAKPPLVFGADSMTGVKCVRPDPKRNDRWINSKVTWYQTLGEKISALTAGDVNGDGVGEVVAGTKLGSVFVLNAEDGEVRATARPGGARVTTLVVDDATRRVLAGRADGSVLEVALTK